MQIGNKVSFNNDLREEFNKRTKTEPGYRDEVLALADEIGTITEMGHSVVTVEYEIGAITIPKYYLLVLPG